MTKDLRETLQNKMDLVRDSDLPDTLFELRRAWGNVITYLNEACFDELAENYGGEDYEDALDAFAQELTVAGYQLYRNSEDDVDTFIYAEEKETADLEKLIKKSNLDFRKLRQNGRKFGMSARRNETKDRMPGIKFPEKDEGSAFHSFAGGHVYATRYGKDNKAAGDFVIDLSADEWTANECKGEYYNVVCEESSRSFAAYDSVSKCIVAGKDALHPDKWSKVSPPVGNRLLRLYWHSSNLFFGIGENLYVITNGKCLQISQGKSTYGGVDFVQLADGRIFASNHTALYSVSKNIMAGYAVKRHGFQFMQNGFLSHGTNDGDHVLYCQPWVENGKIIVVLIRLDMDTGQYTYAKLKHIEDFGRIKDWDDDFWYVDGMLDPLIKGRDMAQLINKRTGEVYRIRAGALGKHRLSKAVRLSNGKIVFIISATGLSRLFVPDDLWGYLKESNPTPERLEWVKSDVLYPGIPSPYK